MANRLALIPATAKRAEGVAFEVRLERGAASASEMVNGDLMVGGGGWVCVCVCGVVEVVVVVLGRPCRQREAFTRLARRREQ